MDLQFKLDQFIPRGSEEVIENAFGRVQRLSISVQDYEVYENVEIEGQPSLSRKYTSKPAAEAVVFIWADETSFNNRADIVEWFIVPFEYDEQQLYSNAKHAIMQFIERRANNDEQE